MPHTRISHSGTSRRILIALLATLAAFAMLALVVAPPAQAHVRSVTADCYGWSVALAIYDEGGSVEIWVDDAVVTNIPDFGTDFSETGTWDPTEDHVLRVRVLAFDDPDGAGGLSFDETYTSESCETSPTLKLVKTVAGGTAAADAWTLSASAAAPNAARNFSNPGGSGTFNTVFGGVAYSLAESAGAPSYAAGSWSCSVNEGAPVSGSTITLSNGQSAVCTITNTYTPPSIDIVKEATPTYYGEDGVGTFTITVHNDGPVPLTNVSVSDDIALAIDPSSDCARPIKDLAVDEKVTYTCTVGNLNFAGQALFNNEATATGTGPDLTVVTDTDTASVFPQVLNTTVTTAPPTTTTAAPATTAAPTTTSAPSETLPVTGVAGEQLRGFGIAGLALVLAGIIVLGGAALVGQYRRND